MSGPALIFREIHRLRRFARDLQEQIDRSPRQVKAQQARVARQEEAQRENLDAIKHLKVSTHAKETQLKGTHTQIARYKGQMDTASSTKEMDALKHQIATAEAAGLKLEDEILAEMAEAEERTARVPELEKAVQQVREEYARFEKAQNDKLADWKTQLEQTLAQLKQAETGIPDSIRTQYNRIIAAMGPDGFSVVRGRICEACATTITAQNNQDLLTHQFVTCPACGRILYPPQEPGHPAAAE
jgi:predicted  nucleic acid-binding Zn-ribbon protein